MDAIQDRAGICRGCPTPSTYDYLATYAFPSDTDAQVLCDRMFDDTKIEDGEDVQKVRLGSMCLLDSKRNKTPDNHRAQLYIWHSATQCFYEPAPFTGHQPLWLNADGGVEEGSSTFVSTCIVKNFPISAYPNLTVSCVYKMSDGTLLEPPTTEVTDGETKVHAARLSVE